MSRSSKFGRSKSSRFNINNDLGQPLPASSSSSSLEDTTTNTYRRSERIYSTLSVLTCILIPIYFHWTSLDFVEFVRQNEQLPIPLIIYIFAVEVCKISIIVFIVVPNTNTKNQVRKVSSTIGSIRRKQRSLELGVESGDEGDLKDDGEIFREVPKIGNIKIMEPTGQTSWSTMFKSIEINNSNKIIEFFKGLGCFIFAIGVCHVLTVLLGAPFIADSMLTFQFSIMLVTWLFLPLCINIRPASILQEILFMSLWDTNVEWVQWSRLRFLTTLIGAMAGAIAFPLDWDRPWQRWPIPCVAAAFVSYFLFSIFVLMQVSWLIYRNRVKQFLGYHSLCKVKVY